MNACHVNSSLTYLDMKFQLFKKWVGLAQKTGLMAGRFEVFMRVDQNMEYQQNLGDFAIAFVVLVSRNNKLDSLRLLIAQVLTALETIQAGGIVEIARD